MHVAIALLVSFEAFLLWPWYRWRSEVWGHR